MVLFDASTLIAYLSGDEAVVAFLESHADERTITVPLVLFEVYQGEIFKSSPTDFDELDRRLEWLTVVETDQSTARRAAELQRHCHGAGAPLAPRDAFIAGSAYATGDPLVHRDGDFGADALGEFIEVITV